MKSVESSDGLLSKGVYALVAAQIGLAGYIALFGPQGPLPMHFDMHGNVDRWGGRLEAAGVLLGFAVLTLGLERMMKRLLGALTWRPAPTSPWWRPASARRWALRS